ncbi:MAG TPA: FAD-dependent monooxygenase [Polyangiales bacterium]|nr:FAD-dependent monooxygenase [Polyangiales bacterium]
MDEQAVLIVGAGPVGLSMALGLAQRGQRALVIEKNAQLNRHSKAVVVLPRTLQIFQEWGLEPVFRGRAQWLDRLRVHDPEQRKLLEVDFRVLDDVSAVAAVAILPQDETERILYDACEASALIEVRLGHELVGLEQHAEYVRAEVVADGQSYALEAPHLCACDGAHSRVRELLGCELEGKTYDDYAILADVLVDDERDSKSWPIVDLSARGFHFVVRFADKRWRLVLAVPGRSEKTEPPNELIQTEIERLLGPGPIEVLWKSSFHLHMRSVAHFRNQRVLLLGDAAHLTSPAGGQGMNAGIQDAHNLAWKLAAIARGANAETYLDSYDRERHDAIRHNVDVFTDRLTRYGIDAPPKLRRAAFELVHLANQLALTKRRIVQRISMLDLRYRPSPLIESSGGELLEDLLLTDGRRLRQAIGHDGAVLQVERSKIRFAGQQVETANLDHHSKYLVVRPDYVIAYAGSNRRVAERTASTLDIGWSERRSG